MFLSIPSSWQSFFDVEIHQEYFRELDTRVQSEYQNHTCFPCKDDIFRAFELTQYQDLRVVIIWQDPYHTPGAAMGLAFSVPDGAKTQPSLRNIFKEIYSDIGTNRTRTDLSDWADQWILLLNTALTVREWEAGSHADIGWHSFTDHVISMISENNIGIIFLLWGNHAQSKLPLIDMTKHHIIQSAHPSPFSAYRGFFGSWPFSQINTILQNQWKDPIIWG